MIVEKLSKTVATYLSENTHDKQKYSYNKLYYGLQIIINFVIVTTIIMLLSALLGVFSKTMFIYIMIVLLRQWSGGLHVKSTELCAVVSIILPIGMALIPDVHHYFLVDMATAVIILIYAPATFKVSKTRKVSAYNRMKVLSVLMVLSNILIFKDSKINIIYTIQAFSVIVEYYRLKKRDVRE